MGTTHQLTDHRSFTRIAITLLATLSLLAAQLVFLPGAPAQANQNNWSLGGQVTLADYAGVADQVWLSGTASEGNIGDANGQATCAEIATLQGLDPADVRFASPRSGGWNASGTESVGDGTITQTVAADGRHWIWDAQGIQILAAFSKGGPSFHTFIYHPVATSDIVDPIAPGGLVSPGTAGLSHSAFCWLGAPAPEPAIELVKTASAEVVEPGDGFSYTVTATSTGEATATGVTITDAVPAPFLVTSASYQVDDGDAVACNTDDGVTCGPVDLPVDAVMKVTIDVSVPDEVAEEACGSTTNVANASAEGDIDVTSDPVDVDIDCPDDPELTPAIELVKTATDADVPFDVLEGQLILNVTDQESATVTYEFEITNVGNQPLLDVALTDDRIGAIDVPVETLGVDESVTVTATYDLTEADIDAGFVTNVGITTAVAQVTGEPVEATDDETVFVVEVEDLVLEPAITIVKEALIDVDEDGIKTVTVGDDGTAEIVYRYTITNTGDADLFDVTLVDDVIGDLTDELSVTFLAVGESTVVDVPYTTTAAELAAGRVDNIATTTGTTVEGAVTEAEDDETVFLVEVLDTVEPLPKTGADTWLLTAVGLLLTLLGAATLLLGTRRGQHGEA